MPPLALPDPYVADESLRRNFEALARELGVILDLFRFGTGSPEGVVTAPQGAIFLRAEGGATTTVYQKSSGGTAPPTNTGWTALS
jgi:hypothetical protein